MSDRSQIQWTDATWNPVRGCSRVSEGCRHCYAERTAGRFAGPGQPYEGLAKMTPSGPRWTGEVRFVEEALTLPLRWKKPRRIFVNSMSDLFHERVEDEWIDRIFAVMIGAPQHTFQILTKRPERMLDYMRFSVKTDDWGAVVLRHIWLGVSVEDQATADERIPLLLQTPAAFRWVSYEPALGPVDFSTYLPRVVDTDDGGNDLRAAGIDLLIVGGESGPGARPCDLAWIRSPVAQCRAAMVPVFVKQLGAHVMETRGERGADGPDAVTAVSGMRYRDRKGADPSEWPEDLRVREWPT